MEEDEDQYVGGYDEPALDDPDTNFNKGAEGAGDERMPVPMAMHDAASEKEPQVTGAQIGWSRVELVCTIGCLFP